MSASRKCGRALLGAIVALAALCVAAVADARTVTLGRSVQGRAITAQVLGPDSAARKILLVGGIHGNECAGRAILSEVARPPVPSGVQPWLRHESKPH